MDLSHPNEQDNPISGVGTPSLILTLERGLNCIRQERYVEGIALLALACEQLSPDQVDLSAALNAFIQGHALYWQAQQALHHASQRFTEALTSQQTRLTTLHHLLTALVEDKESTSQPHTGTAAQSVKDPQQYQVPEPATDDRLLPALFITCFGHFEVRRSGRPVALCSNRSGQSILRFLVARREHCATSDMLQALLWPEDSPEGTLNKLHIAISALRRSLNHGCSGEPGSGYIVCKNRVYYLNPAVEIRTDVEEFLHYYRAGQQADEERIALYERACHFYMGPFLCEDIYADWSSLQREELSRTYLTMCKALAEHYMQHKQYEDAVQWTTAMLKENRCDEAAHQQLMQIYAIQGRRSEALQQYQRCKLILDQELGVQPLPETVLLFQALLVNEPTSNCEYRENTAQSQ
jgi:DNA-binding SARP family transcriptional activator/exonuclease VII small subunit